MDKIESGLALLHAEGPCEFVGRDGSMRINDQLKRGRRMMDFQGNVSGCQGLVLDQEWGRGRRWMV